MQMDTIAKNIVNILNDGLSANYNALVFLTTPEEIGIAMSCQDVLYTGVELYRRDKLSTDPEIIAVLYCMKKTTSF
jgi:hypothetical protein